MKLIIDIPDKMYETVQNGTYCGTLYEELKNGTPLSESEDCVSRQAAIDAIKKLHSIETEYDCTLYEKLDVLYELEDLPPVTPVKKQEPCTDAISREAVLKCFTLDNTKADVWNNIKALPSVTSKLIECGDCISRQAVLEKAICVPIARVVTEDKVIYRKIVFVDEIENIPPVTPQPNKWIPVSERLPEEYKEVIVTDIETSDTYQSQYIGNGYWECDNGQFMNRIIAWMPLPEPYKASPTGAEGSDK